MSVVDLEPEPKTGFVYQSVINSIDAMAWESLDTNEMLRVAKAYYYFSVQFRRNLEIARKLYPDDPKLLELWKGECHTDNLSPWPGIADPGEKMHHDEFMRRLIWLNPGVAMNEGLSSAGGKYLKEVRLVDQYARAASLASYEDGGLATVFMAMLRSKG